jgi:hypothetical protein
LATAAAAASITAVRIGDVAAVAGLARGRRLARPQTRASTVVFSNKAVLRRIRGEYYFMFQVRARVTHAAVTATMR